VQDGRDLVEHDPQLRARRFFVRAEHPVAGGFLHEGLTAHLRETPGGIRHSAPVLGADTDDVLTNVLGVSEVRLAALRASNVLT
jgi:crotonobetainyl-CoA:carnitine CoA-transferase CaiB-like acyl-CoA transferase